jgi:hypothetical protein
MVFCSILPAARICAAVSSPFSRIEFSFLKDIVVRLRTAGYEVRGAMANSVGAAWAVSRYGCEQSPSDPAHGRWPAIGRSPPASRTADRRRSNQPRRNRNRPSARDLQLGKRRPQHNNVPFVGWCGDQSGHSFSTEPRRKSAQLNFRVAVLSGGFFPNVFKDGRSDERVQTRICQHAIDDRRRQPRRFVFPRHNGPRRAPREAKCVRLLIEHPKACRFECSL